MVLLAGVIYSEDNLQQNNQHEGYQKLHRLSVNTIVHKTG